MKVKTWVPLGVAVVLGLIAAKLTRDSMANRRGPSAPVALTAVVTAAADIAPGQPLTADLLTTGKMSAGSVPVGAFQSPDELAERVALTGLVKGQPVLESMLAPVGTAAGVQALIPPGMRAITVEVNEFSGLAGMLSPGSRVDIISVVKVDDGTQDQMARTIVQNVEVRAIGRQITGAAMAAAAANDPSASAFVNNVTLLVSPAEAEALQLAGSGGRPWLVLRNTRDTAPFDSHGTSLADLRGEPAKGIRPEVEVAVVPPPPVEPVKPETNDVFDDTPPAPAKPRQRAVTFIKGTKEETVQVDLGPIVTETLTTTDPGDATGAK